VRCEEKRAKRRREERRREAAIDHAIDWAAKKKQAPLDCFPWAPPLSVLFARSLDHPFAFARGGGKGPPIPISTLVLTSYYRPNPISTGIQNRKRTA